MMSKTNLQTKPLEPLDNLAAVRRYFREIQRLDRAAMAGQPVDVGAIMRLWAADSQLVLTGPEAIGKHEFSCYKDLAGFYEGRANGVPKLLSTLFARVNVVNAKSGQHIVASGVRYAVNSRGEGIEAPFTHNFKFDARGRISSLHINIGQPGPTELAPQGRLSIQDMGELARAAWMVA